MNVIVNKGATPLTPDVQELRPAEVLRWLYRHRIVLGVATLLAAVVAALVSFTIPRSYQASAILRPVITNNTTTSLANALGSSLGGIAGAVFGGVPRAADDATVTLAYMESMEFVRLFITQENLLPELYPEQWDETRKAWKGDAPSLDKAAEQFLKSFINIKENGDGLVELRVTWSSPGRAQQLAKAFIALVNEKRKERALDQASANFAYLNERLQRETVFEMRTMLSDLAGKEVTRIMLAQGPGEYALETVSPPYASPYPVAPARTLMAVMGAVLGFSVAALSLLVLQAVRPPR